MAIIYDFNLFGDFDHENNDCQYEYNILENRSIDVYNYFPV